MVEVGALPASAVRDRAGRRRPLDRGQIPHLRNEHLHVDATLRREIQGGEENVVGEEVGRDDPHRASGAVEGNFALNGLLGFDLHGRTVGVVGTGRIGAAFSRIMTGFGCRVLGHDPQPSDECRGLGVEYVPFEALLERSDVVSLHCPLTPDTYHLMDAEALARMKPGGMLTLDNVTAFERGEGKVHRVV